MAGFLGNHFKTTPRNGCCMKTPETPNRTLQRMRINHAGEAGVKLQPPHFSVSLFITGLALFLLAVAVWVAVLFVHFRRPKSLN
jgi:hypothetical protein